jgi:hypothetical protein
MTAPFWYRVLVAPFAAAILLMLFGMAVVAAVLKKIGFTK